jgi:hypothetical protein
MKTAGVVDMSASDCVSDAVAQSTRPPMATFAAFHVCGG